MPGAPTLHLSADLKAQLAGRSTNSAKARENPLWRKLSGFFRARPPGVAELIDNLQGD
jgi:hypothetical protein